MKTYKISFVENRFILEYDSGIDPYRHPVFLTLDEVFEFIRSIRHPNQSGAV